MSRGKIEYTPIRDIPTSQLESIGETLHNLVARPGLRETLLARNLLGVVERHSQSAEASVEHLKRVQRDSQAQKLSAFAIFQTIDTHLPSRHAERKTSFVGMATIQEGLPLYVQKLPIPPKFTRNNTLGQKIDAPLFNVSAWTTEPFIDHSVTDTDTILSDAYKFLVQQLEATSESPCCWTLATRINRTTDAYYKKILESAGLVRVAFEAPGGSEVIYRRFDEFESGRKPVPFSALYVDAQSYAKKALDNL